MEVVESHSFPWKSVILNFTEANRIITTSTEVGEEHYHFHGRGYVTFTSTEAGRIIFIFVEVSEIIITPVEVGRIILTSTEAKRIIGTSTEVDGKHYQFHVRKYTTRRHISRNP